jgi:predicted PurR-regulated permease PerM
MKTVPQPGPMILMVAVSLTCLLLYLFQKMLWFVLPFLFALVLYYCLRPVVQSLMIRGMSHGAAAKTVWILLQLISVGAVIAIGFLAIIKASTWQDSFDRYASGGQNLLVESAGTLEKIIPPFKNMRLSAQVEQQIWQYTNGFAEKQLLPVFMQALKWLPSVLLVPYIMYFMLVDSARLKKYLIRSVPNAFFEKALLLCSQLDASLQNYFQGLLQLTLLDTLCLGLGLSALGMHNALWLGLGAAVLAWIPYLGSLVGGIMVVLIAATDFPEKLWLPYACLGLFVGVRLLDDFVFMPLTVGRKLHVHPLLSVLMLFLGAAVAGATGLVLVLPLFGVVAVVGETVSQVVTDPRLKARYKAARQLATSY